MGYGQRPYSFGNDEAALLQKAQEVRKAEDATGGAKDGRIGNLRLHQVGGRYGGVDTNQGILLCAEIELVLVQEGFAEADLVQSVALEYALRADLVERILDLGNGGGDVVPGKQVGRQILQSTERAAGSVLENLASWDVGVDRIAVGKLDGRDIGVAIVSDGVGGGVQHERRRGY